MKFATVAAINFAISSSTPCLDDSVINAANNATLTQDCGTPRTIATVFADYVNNPNSEYTYGLCGSTNCVNQINGLNYPSCDPNTATSNDAPISNFSTACSPLSNDLTAGGGACTLGNTADYLWAKYQVTLTTNCAAALANFSYTTSSLWYSVVTSLNLITNDLTTAFWENLYTTATNAINYCVNPPTPAPTTAAPAPTTATPAPTITAPPNTTTVAPNTTTTSPNTITIAPTPAPTVAPSDCDASINAANNWTMSQACTNDLQGGSPPSLNAIYADIAARSSTTVYCYGLCGSTNCAADFTNIVRVCSLGFKAMLPLARLCTHRSQTAHAPWTTTGRDIKSRSLHSARTLSP
ncbi:hypothetical protein AC1031_007746 [Aphanomyces cochlioides]|nr:hypothetical protein AC1031_007746 [Aphanomyces cochlioides]